MKVLEAEKIISEIKQMIVQYRAEVGSERRAWPRSIQMRVFELIEMGFSIQSISTRLRGSTWDQ